MTENGEAFHGGEERLAAASVSQAINGEEAVGLRVRNQSPHRFSLRAASGAGVSFLVQPYLGVS